MRITSIRERTFAISRYADPEIPSGGLDTSAVAIVTDAVRDGAPVVGYGFTSIGRFAQRGLIEDRFAPRLTAMADGATDAATGVIDPFKAWSVMMAGEKPGGHGERCVAVGALDMALWDASAKAAGLPLYRYLAERLGAPPPDPLVRVYAGGGYYFPHDDIGSLVAEMESFRAAGHTHAKIKVGGGSLDRDLDRIGAALEVLGGGRFLAVDAMNAYDRAAALAAARAFEGLDLWWFEDICDPLDFATLAEVADRYAPPVAAGEALFSFADARNLLRYGGLRRDRDVLLFDIAHSYGIPEYLRMVALAEGLGWDRARFFPHGGHLFTAHVVAALGLGGAEVNPHNFQPFGGLADGMAVRDGTASLPDTPGIGFEGRAALSALLDRLT